MDTHGLGYRRVDGDPNVDVLLDTMDATGRWASTQTLRAWEREHLGLRAGQRLLDVGCGLGDAALALALDAGLGAGGEVVGVDLSAEMVEEATSRAAAAGVRARFVVGDAAALDESGGAFDAVRSERVLQWLPDPARAVSEMARVLRPGGRVSLIDTDWSTFAVEVVGDEGIGARVREAMATERRRPSHVGRRLGELAGAAGLEVVARTSATQRWASWDPDESPAPDGCCSMASLADDLVDAGQLRPDERAWFVSTVVKAARDGRFRMALTMFGVVARRPGYS